MAAVATLLAMPAHAVPITATYDITATNFVSSPAGTSPPVATVHLNFTIQTDADGVPIGPTSAGLTINSTNITLGSVSFGWSPFGNTLTFGTDITQSGGVFGFNLVPDTNGIGVVIGSAFSTSPSLITLGYTQATSTDTGAAFFARISNLGSSPAPVPAPASLPVIVSGLVALALVRVATRASVRAAG
jgi:hypothetical protein